MASITSGAIASVSRAMHNPTQACMLPPSTGAKSNSVFPVTRKLVNDLTLSSSGNGGRVQSMLMQEISVSEVRPSFSNASFNFAETKPKDLGVSGSFAFGGCNETNNKKDDGIEGDGFEFETLCRDHEVLTISADEIFLDGKIRSIPPAPLVHAHSEAKATRNMLKKFLEEERVSEAQDASSIDPNSFCAWKPKSSEEGTKKSSSTNSSRRWKLRDLIRRSHSDGGEIMMAGKEALPAREVVKSAHEIHYTKNRALKEADKRRSFLPYRKDIVGLFGNVNGLSKALKPVLG